MAANRFTVEDVADSSGDESFYPCACCGIQKRLSEYYHHISKKGRRSKCKKCEIVVQNMNKCVNMQKKTNEMNIWKARFPSELHKLVVAFKATSELRRRHVPFNFDKFFRAYDDKPDVLGRIDLGQSGGRRRLRGKTDLKGRLAGLNVDH